jgi:hypothetical protein
MTSRRAAFGSSSAMCLPPLRCAAARRVLKAKEGGPSVTSAPGIFGVVAVAALTGGLVACGTTSQSAQPAAVRPSSAAADRVRVQSDVTGWSGMVQRPQVIYVGMGGAPVARQLAWRHWGSPQAWASGKLDIYWSQPGPIAGWHPATHTVTVRLQDIETRNGQPSYRKMTYTYVNRRGVAKSLQFKFSIQPGGSTPSWNPARPGTSGGAVEPAGV